MGFSRTGLSGQRSAFKVLAEEKFLSHNLIVGFGTIAAGLLGVAFQSLVSHQFRPSDYGSVFGVITLLNLVGLPASAFTLLMAREASRDMGSGRRSGAELLRNGTVTLLLAGAGLGVVLAAASPVIGGFLRIPTAMLIVAATATPFTVASPLLMGSLQGRQRFISFSSLSAGQAGLKILAALALGLFFGPVGVIAGITSAGVITYVIALALLRKEFGQRSSAQWLRPAARYLAVILPSTLALAALLSADVVLVKHYFPARQAGEYSAVAALGRAIFWGASGVAAVMFPKIVLRRTQGAGSGHLLGLSLGLVLAGGIAGFALLSVASSWLLGLFAGAAYGSAAGYLPWYAVGMTLLGGVSVLTAAHQSHGRAAFLAILIPLTVFESLLIAAFHETLLQVIQVVDISVALIALGLAALLVMQERAEQRSGRVQPVVSTTTARASANS